VLLGSVLCKIISFYFSLLPVALEEVDLTRALGTEHVQPEAQRFRLSVNGHDIPT
jgi:hypothetical protein